MALCSGKRPDGSFCMNAVLSDGHRCRDCQERAALAAKAGEDLVVLEALCTCVSGDASGVALGRAVHEHLGRDGSVMTTSAGLSRLEDLGLAEPVSRNAMPRGASSTRLWRPTAAGWRLSPGAS